VFSGRVTDSPSLTYVQNLHLDENIVLLASHNLIATHCGSLITAENDL
jgi:hypothetical protein